MFPVIPGAIIGVLSGILSVVAFAGPLDLPILGLFVATGLVASGSWLAYRLKGMLCWGYFTLVTVLTIGWLIFWPMYDAIRLVPNGWFTDVWLVLQAVAIVVPPLMCQYFDRIRRAKKRQADGEGEASVVEPTEPQLVAE